MKKSVAENLVIKMEALEQASARCRAVASMMQTFDANAIEEAQDKYATARTELVEAFEAITTDDLPAKG